MPEKLKVDLGNVQKTLFLPLWGRAQETQKADPLLVDPLAVEVMNRVDFDFTAIAANMSPLSQFAWIQRSRLGDVAIRNFLEEHPGGTIVNIGCGLDTTFSRVDNGKLLWYDLDLSDVIALRRQFIPETGRSKTIAASFLDENWPNEIIVHDGVFWICCGVFYYFTEAEVKGFLKRLTDRFPGSEIFFDVSSPRGVKIANKMVIKNAGMDERSYLTWGLAHPRDLLAWDSRFRILDTLFYFREGRMDASLRFAGWISDMMKIQYLIRLKLGG